MRVQPWFLIQRLESSEEALGGGGSGGPCRAAAGLSLPCACGSAPACLAACADVGQGDRLTLTLSLAQAGGRISGIFPPETLHFWLYLFCLQYQ